MDTVDRVVHCFGSQVRRQPTETVELEKALGRFIAEDLRASFPWPPFHCSLRDGFALDHRAVLDASPEKPVVLQVGQIVPAGGVSTQAVGGFGAARILTGALLPPGATTVIPFEEVEIRDQTVLVRNPVPPGQYIRRKGSMVEAGEVVISRGSQITPPEIELLASAGCRLVSVYCQPVVSILPVGSELVEPGEPLPEGKIYASNGYTIAAWTLLWGGRPNRLNSIPDNLDLIVERVSLLLAGSDLVVTTGGASNGDYDLAARVLGELQATDVVRIPSKTAGGPFIGGFVGDTPILGFSGSPKAAVRAAKIFLRPLLAKMQGAQDYAYFTG